MTDRVQVLIEGRVQGVGYRFSAYQQALALGLRGWVRNLPDGRVEAECEGAKADLEKMVAWCRRGPHLAKVSEVEATWETGPERYPHFQIRGE